MKGEKHAADIGPAEAKHTPPTLAQLAGLVRKLPRLGEEGERFEADLRAIRRRQPLLPLEGSPA